MKHCTAKMIVMSAVLTAGILFGAMPAGAAEKTYETRSVTAKLSDGRTIPVACRFYEDMPNIPYVRLQDFYVMLNNHELRTEKRGEGHYRFTTVQGAWAEFDTRTEEFTTPDLWAFTNPNILYEDIPAVMFDFTSFTRFRSVSYDREPAALSYSFADYGIDLHDDGSTVWIPFASASELFSNFMLSGGNYNGETIYMTNSVQSDHELFGEGYYNAYQKYFTEGAIPEDVAQFSYATMCYMVDHYYGYPGRCYFSEAVRQKGLDCAMQETDQATRKVREALLSTDPYTYYAGMVLFNEMFADGGHTNMSFSLYYLNNAITIDSALADKSVARLRKKSGYYPEASEDPDIASQRSAVFGGEVYHESGDTAVYSMNDFMPDNEAWTAYYQGTAGIPDDCFGGLIQSLNRAKENPEIHNFVIDITCNGGGSTDVSTAVLSLLTGRDEYTIHTEATDQTITTRLWIDKNLDGQFDERDDEVTYPFRFALLESRKSFSCGNLLPSQAKENGVLILGEKSGGGSCAIVRNTFGNGLGFFMSLDWKLFNAAGEDLDLGVEPHRNLLRGASDYSAFYDLDVLSRECNAYYGAYREPSQDSAEESSSSVSGGDTESSGKEDSSRPGESRKGSEDASSDETGAVKTDSSEPSAEEGSVPETTEDISVKEESPQSETAPPVLLWVLLPAGIAVTAAAAVIVMKRRKNGTRNGTRKE